MLSCAVRLTRAGFLRYATYRQAVLAGLVTNTVFGFLRAAVVLTVFTGSARVAGYDPASALTFVWVGQGLWAVVVVYGDAELAGRVRTGQVSADLLRPVDLQATLLTEDLGRAGFAMLTRFAVPVVIGGLAFELALPSSPVRWVASALSATPFPGMVQTPTDLLLGRDDAAWLLAGELLWAVLLLGAGRLVLARAVRRLVVQGG